MRTIRKIITVFLATLVFPLLFAGVVFAADFKITGTALDNNHNPVAHVKVTAANALTSQAVASATSDQNGYYSLSVAKGTYNITMVPPLESGLQSTTYPHIVVSSDISLHSNLNTVGKAPSAGSNITVQSPAGRSKPLVVVLVIALIILVVVGLYLWKKKKSVEK